MTEGQKENAQWCIDRLKEGKLNVSSDGRECFFHGTMTIDVNVANRTIYLLQDLILGNKD